MYLPDHFTERSAPEVSLLVHANPLACIVAHTDDGLVANHIPTFLTPRNTLVGHIALKNDMHRLMSDGYDVLAIFRGDDAYVSPQRYPTKSVHHRHVPTWNYQVVHFHGRISFQHDDHSKRSAVALLTRDHERRANGAAIWQLSDAPEDYMDQMLAGIVAFRIDIDQIVAKSKLSQNREDVDHAGVIADFDATGHHALADRMRRDRE